MLRVQDVWLAALAIQHNLKLLTQNQQDFEGIPGLHVIAMPAARSTGGRGTAGVMSASPAPACNPPPVACVLMPFL